MESGGVSIFVDEHCMINRNGSAVDLFGERRLTLVHLASCLQAE